MSAITTAEQARLIELESTIESNVAMVGKALFEIREGKLYRATHKTFEEYCQERFAMSRNYINRQIKAAEIIETLVPKGTKTAITETQVRPLTKLPESEQRQAAWTKAEKKAKDEGKPVAARHVEEAVAEARWPESVVVNGVAEEPKDSERISLLKSTWNKASKKEKVQFAAWINKNWKL